MVTAFGERIFVQEKRIGWFPTGVLRYIAFRRENYERRKRERRGVESGGSAPCAGGACRCTAVAGCTLLFGCRCYVHRGVRWGGLPPPAPSLSLLATPFSPLCGLLMQV